MFETGFTVLAIPGYSRKGNCNNGFASEISDSFEPLKKTGLAIRTHLVVNVQYKDEYIMRFYYTYNVYKYM